MDSTIVSISINSAHKFYIYMQPTYTQPHTHRDTHPVIEQGLIRTLTQTLIAEPALFPADFLSSYFAQSVLLLWSKTSRAEHAEGVGHSESNTNQGKSVWSACHHLSLLSSLPFSSYLSFYYLHPMLTSSSSFGYHFTCNFLPFLSSAT